MAKHIEITTTATQLLSIYLLHAMQLNAIIYWLI